VRQRRRVEIAIGWYQDDDSVGHTGILLIIDGHRRFMIDYGKNLRNRAPRDRVVIRKFHPRGNTLKGVFAYLKSDQLREFLTYYCTRYHAKFDMFNHNSRHFVRNVVERLCRQGRTYEHVKDKIKRELVAIIGADMANHAAVLGAAGGAAGGAIGGGPPGAVVGGISGAAVGWFGVKASTSGGNF